MELRVLEYFLAVAREQSISGAAEYLHLTQPTLSRQLRELEEELGCTLLVRGKRGQRTALTPEGRLFRQRAQEILDLASKAEQEVRQSGKGITGDVMIGAGETDSMRVIARLTEAHPPGKPRNPHSCGERRYPGSHRPAGTGSV